MGTYKIGGDRSLKIHIEIERELFRVI